MTTRVVPRPGDLLDQLNRDMYDRARDKKMSLSAWLDQEYGSDEYKDRLDTYGRLLRVANIRVRDVPEAGVYADTLDAFHKNDRTKVLLPEFFARCFRRASSGSRGLYTTADNVVGSIERPYYDAMQARAEKQIAPAIPLSSLVSMTTPVAGGPTYRTTYLKSDPTQQRLRRVSEGAHLPRFKLATAAREITLYKYGGAIETTYEQMRRMRIDKVAFHIAMIGVQAEVDRVAVAIDTLVNGDGNTGTAATVYTSTSLDAGASGGNLTLKAWLAFKAKFTNPYQLDTALMQEAVALQLQLLSATTSNTPLVTIQEASGFGSLRAINPELRGAVSIGWTADAPTATIVGFDSRFAIERAIETGSNISEIDRFISNQTQLLTMSENEGYATIDPNAVKVLQIL